VPPPEASRELYRLLQRLQLVLVLAGRRAWAGMDPDDFDGSWRRIGPALVAVTAAAQLAAARAATSYVPAVLAETGQPDAPLARVRPEAFTGRASDGRSLAGLLTGAVVHAKRATQSSMFELDDGEVVTWPGLPAAEALARGGRWLDTALRTTTTDAARDATQAEIITREGMGWVRMVNPPSCSRCAVLAGQWYRHNDIMPRHPSCFPAGVVVSGPGHRAATRRWFQGELVVLTTASGQQLPLTGNHPVLTRRGWLPANLLHEGDEVVRSTAPEGAHALVVPDHHEMPARIEDVWGALSVAGLHAVPSAPEDFHGDGQHGQVDVVGAYGTLDDRLFASLDEHVAELSFSLGPRSPFSLDCERAAKLLDLWQAPPSGGLVGGHDLGLALLFGHSGGADTSRFAGSPPSNAGVQQSFRDRAAGDSVLAREPVLAGARFVGLDDLRHREVPLAPRWDAPGDSFSVETAAGYTSRGLDLRDRLSSQVELDRVVELRRSEWSGHVYSLTSIEGWHSANSLIVSNCDCILIPSRENVAGDFTTDAKQLVDRGLITDLTADQRKRLDEGADLNWVLNESRDRWRERMAADRRAAKAREQWAGGGAQPPAASAATVHDFMAHLTSRADAINAMRAAGIAT
jgi:hypothetical protein